MRLAPRLAEDSGSLVLGWLLRMSLGIGLMGVVAFDGLSVAVTRINAIDDASTAAAAAADVLRGQPRNLNAAYKASLVAARDAGASIVSDSWYVERDGSVHLTLQKQASTVVLKHIPPLQPVLTVRVTDSSTPLR